MEEIGIYINAKNDSKTVYEYCLSKFEKYWADIWEKAEYYFNNPEEIEKKESIALKRRRDVLEGIKKTLLMKSSLEEKWDDYIKWYKEDFLKTDIFNNSIMLIIGEFLANTRSWLCGKEIRCYFVDSSSLKNEKIFLVLDGIGYFSQENWLYAYFNGINLAGLSSNYETHFDGKYGLPALFLEHDYNHIKYLEKRQSDDTFLKNLYEKIKGYTSIIREICIFIIYTIIHEYYHSVNDNEELKGILFSYPFFENGKMNFFECNVVIPKLEELGMIYTDFVQKYLIF